MLAFVTPGVSTDAMLDMFATKRSRPSTAYCIAPEVAFMAHVERLNRPPEQQGLAKRSNPAFVRTTPGGHFPLRPVSRPDWHLPVASVCPEL